MRLNMLMLFCIAVLFMTLQTVLTETVQSSVITADCLSNGDLYQMYVDTAQVSFSLERNGSPVGAFLNAFALFAVNADCYECLPQIVLPANATTINKCAQMWSPFNWTFTVRNTVTHEEFPNLNLTTVFGERGSYTLTAFLTSDTTPVFVGLNVATVAQPENSLTALWIWLFAIFLPIIILNFTGAPIAVWLRQQWCRCCEYFQRYISCFHSKASESATSNGCDPAEYRLLEDGNADITTPLTAKALDGRLKEQPSAAEQASSPYPINTPAKANYTPSQAAGSFWEAFMSPAAGTSCAVLIRSIPTTPPTHSNPFFPFTMHVMFLAWSYLQATISGLTSHLSMVGPPLCRCRSSALLPHLWLSTTPIVVPTAAR